MPAAAWPSGCSTPQTTTGSGARTPDAVWPSTSTSWGFDSDALKAGKAWLRSDDLHCYIEVHIEQGPVLLDSGLALGVVTGIRGNLRYRYCRIDGVYSHAGGIPLRFRRDAVFCVRGIRPLRGACMPPAGEGRSGHRLHDRRGPYRSGAPRNYQGTGPVRLHHGSAEHRQRPPARAGRGSARGGGPNLRPPKRRHRSRRGHQRASSRHG